MSYGTILYPDLKDFPLQDSYEKYERSIDAEVTYMANKFGVFRTLAICTPRNIVEGDIIKKITDMVEEAFEDYVGSYNHMSKLSDVIDLHKQASLIKEGDAFEDGTPKRPILYFNHFVYHSKEEAEGILTDNVANLGKIKARILGICLATPKDITPSNDDGQDPLWYIEREMDYIEESLDDCLRSIRVAKLVIKYWDGHEEG